MKMKNKILISVIIFIGLFAFNIFPIHAANEYTPLEPLPGIGPEPGYSSYNLSSYLQWVFAFAISIAGILAVLMIVIGGIQYITAYGNPNQIENAKNRIYQALLGLLLAISAWLILNTINPDLIKGVLNITPI
jgi:TRAP-type C4-dicarboxylate transport system permease small subunit